MHQITAKCQQSPMHHPAGLCSRSGGPCQTQRPLPREETGPQHDRPLPLPLPSYRGLRHGRHYTKHSDSWEQNRANSPPVYSSYSSHLLGLPAQRKKERKKGKKGGRKNLGLNALSSSIFEIFFSNNFINVHLFSNFSQNMSSSESLLTIKSLWWIPPSLISQRDMLEAGSDTSILWGAFLETSTPSWCNPEWCNILMFSICILSFIRIRDKKPVGVPLRKFSHIWLLFLSPSLSSSLN